MTVGEKIRSARIQSGLSQDDLANVVGVTRATISRWEKGTTSPSVKDLNVIADYLNTDFYEFKAPADDRYTIDDMKPIIDNLDDLSRSIKDIRLDLINLEKERCSTRKAIIIAVVVSVVLTVATFFAVIIFFNWPASKDEQPLKIEYLNEPISQTSGGTNG